MSITTSSRLINSPSCFVNQARDAEQSNAPNRGYSGYPSETLCMDRYSFTVDTSHSESYAGRPSNPFLGEGSQANVAFSCWWDHQNKPSDYKPKPFRFIHPSQKESPPPEFERMKDLLEKYNFFGKAIHPDVMSHLIGMLRSRKKRSDFKQESDLASLDLLYDLTRWSYPLMPLSRTDAVDKGMTSTSKNYLPMVLRIWDYGP